MAINFPNSPSNGATHTVGNITYVYDSSKGVWKDSPAGLTQGIDALTDVDISTSAPTNGQILEYNSSSGKFVPADSSAGVTVYATIDDLPLTGVTEGSMALVDSTDKLYIFSDTGWYSIALVNTSPSISGVNATYSLATNGSATTITVTASDPEGVPLTYSIVSDTSGNIATVTQGTGSNTNQWTITPSTNTANAGSFTLVFRASDGTNVASASSTFSLVFSIPNSKYTTALITSVGANNAVNNSFDDASTNNHTITANGNVTQNTFSPYRHGGNSVSFAGTNSSSENYLWINAAIVPATGSWTYESWVRVDRRSDTERHSLISWYTNGVSGRGNIFVRAGGENNPGIVFVYVDGMSAYPQSTTRVDDGEWHHVVVERDGNVWSVWVDGTREDQETQNVTVNTSVNTRLGHIINTAATSHSPFQGEMRDVRFSASARYQGAASINVPTEDQTTTTGYALLCCQSFDPFTDKTGNREITVYSSTSVKQVGAGPYDHIGYSASSHGGSMYFDGSGDYLSIADATSVRLGSGEFTVEFWIYMTSLARTVFVDKYDGTSAGWQIQYRDYNNVNHIAFSTQAGHYATTPSNEIEANTWYHVAAVRDSSDTLKIYINGAEKGSSSNYTQDLTNTTGLNIGVQTYNIAAGYMNGFISDVRIVKGTAVNYSNFPPTAPLTAITNTSLLLNGTDAGIIDKSQSIKTITLNGDVKSSTAQYKYLTSSMYFDGTGDSLTIGNNQGLHIGSVDFTIEMWLRAAAVNTNQTLMLRRSAVAARGLVMNINSSAANKLGFVAGDSTIGAWEVSMTSTSNLSANTWHHVAIVRSGNNFYLYLDGTQEATASSSATIADDTSNLLIGTNDSGTGYFSGYISDLRITKGLARYTAADETANIPSAALEG